MIEALDNVFCRKGKTSAEDFENHKVVLKNPVGSNEGPWDVMDPFIPIFFLKVLRRQPCDGYNF